MLSSKYDCIWNNGYTFLPNDGVSRPVFPGTTTDATSAQNFWSWGYQQVDSSSRMLERMHETASMCKKWNINKIAVHYLSRPWIPDYYVIHCFVEKHSSIPDAPILITECDAMYDAPGDNGRFSLGSFKFNFLWAVYDSCQFLDGCAPIAEVVSGVADLISMTASRFLEGSSTKSVIVQD